MPTGESVHSVRDLALLMGWAGLEWNGLHSLDPRRLVGWFGENEFAVCLMKPKASEVPLGISFRLLSKEVYF